MLTKTNQYIRHTHKRFIKNKIYILILIYSNEKSNGNQTNILNTLPIRSYIRHETMNPSPAVDEHGSQAAAASQPGQKQSQVCVVYVHI